MGLGKTVSTLTALHHLELVTDGPALVIAPLRVAGTTWPAEVAKWDHLAGMDVVPVLGNLEARTAALRRDAPVYTINYDNVPWLVEQFRGRYPWPFKTVIADESTRLKGFRSQQGTKRAKALAAVAHLHVDRWWNLTGTPAPNGLIDLWGQQWFVDAGQALGRTYTAFENRWFQHYVNKVKLTGGKVFNQPAIRPTDWAQDQIEERLRPTCVSLRPEDWFKLDKVVERDVFIELPPKARRLYRDMERDFYMELDGYGVEAVHAASKSMKLLQLAAGAAWVDTEAGVWREVHTLKIEALESIANEAAGMPVLVSYHWKPTLARLLKHFPKGRVFDHNPETEAAWNRGEIPMMFAHAASAGHGSNLQDGGNILARFDLWWNFEEYDQILQRIGPVRQLQSGHKRPVFDYRIIARDTEDERVMLRHSSKRSVQDLLMEHMMHLKQRGVI
jgi:SNF2 family DNA or RNA helicase